MKKVNQFICFFLLLLTTSVFSQQAYFPDTEWQSKKPAEVKMNAFIIDSAVKFAIQNDSKTDIDLRIANMKAFAREPF